MNNRSRSGLMVIGSGYLVYIGFNLIKDVLSGASGGSMMFAVIGGIFMILGVGAAVYNIRILLAASKGAEQEMIEEPDPDEAAADHEGSAEDKEEE